MSDRFLSRLIPSLENCKRIPDGKFKRSFFHWVESYDDDCHEYLFKVKERKLTLLEEYPAPTIDEILRDLPTVLTDFPMVSIEYNDGNFIVEYQIGEDSKMREGVFLPDVLLEVWLEAAEKLQRSKNHDRGICR